MTLLLAAMQEVEREVGEHTSLIQAALSLTLCPNEVAFALKVHHYYYVS